MLRGRAGVVARARSSPLRPVLLWLLLLSVGGRARGGPHGRLGNAGVLLQLLLLLLLMLMGGGDGHCAVNLAVEAALLLGSNGRHGVIQGWVEHGAGWAGVARWEVGWGWTGGWVYFVLG